MHIENLNPGDAVTVLRGQTVHTCPMGCCTSERYEDAKGLPLIVLAVDAPYIVAANVLGMGGKIIDARHCTLTKCSDEYVNAFKQMVGGFQVKQLDTTAVVHCEPKDGGGAECAGK